MLPKYFTLILRFYSILPESRDLLGFYCWVSIVDNIMHLALILILNFISALSEENAVGVRFQSRTEYKIITPRYHLISYDQKPSIYQSILPNYIILSDIL